MKLDLRELKFMYIGNQKATFDDACKVFHRDFDPITLSPVISYATRSMRDGETDGKEHYFISKEKAKELLKKKDEIFAYTKIGENEYFVTKDIIKDKNLYIIDPKGINYIKEYFPEIPIHVIYIQTPYIQRKMRCINRSDFSKSFSKRNDDEFEQFDLFELNKGYDDIIYNDKDGSIISQIYQLLNIIKREYYKNPDTMFCFVGRTGSGKDRLTNELKKVINFTKPNIGLTKADKEKIKQSIIQKKLVR